jgi:hypothetical protein
LQPFGRIDALGDDADELDRIGEVPQTTVPLSR